MEKKGRKLNKSLVVVFVLVLLLVVAGIQAYQLTSLKTKISEQGISLGKKTSVQTSGNDLSSLDNLPGMVGGC